MVPCDTARKDQTIALCQIETNHANRLRIRQQYLTERNVPPGHRERAYPFDDNDVVFAGQSLAA